jgi:hypothetical protein
LVSLFKIPKKSPGAVNPSDFPHRYGPLTVYGFVIDSIRTRGGKAMYNNPGIR